MSIQEQQEVKQKYYTESMRYMANAAETLKKAGKQGRHFQDAKYVRTACGTAYSGVLIALDGFLTLKGIRQPRGRRSIEYYQTSIARLDKKLNVELKEAYDILHLSGYYDGITSVPVINTGFEIAQGIIKRIEP